MFKTLGQIFVHYKMERGWLERNSRLIAEVLSMVGYDPPGKSSYEKVTSFSGFTQEQKDAAYDVMRLANKLNTFRKKDLEILRDGLGQRWVGRKIDLALRVIEFFLELTANQPIPDQLFQANGQFPSRQTSKMMYINCDWEPDARMSVTYRPLDGGRITCSASLGFSRADELLEKLDYLTSFNSYYQPFSTPLATPRFLFERSAHYTIASARTLRISFPTPPDLKTTGDTDNQVHLRFLQIHNDETDVFDPLGWMIRINDHVTPPAARPSGKQKKTGDADIFVNLTPYLRKYEHVKPWSNSTNFLSLENINGRKLRKDVLHVVLVQQVRCKGVRAIAADVLAATEDYFKFLHAIERDQRQKQDLFDRRPSQTTYVDDLDDPVELDRLAMSKKLTRAIVNKDSNGIVVDHLRFSLKCPLSQMRIEQPVRGKSCAHIQCFDLVTFLTFSKQTRGTTCPVCNKNTARVSELFICPIYEYALRSFKESDEADFFPDGRIEQVTKSSKSRRLSEKSAPPVSVELEDEDDARPSHSEVVDLDALDEISEPSEPPPQTPTRNSHLSAVSPSPRAPGSGLLSQKRPAGVFIDLTHDDDPPSQHPKAGRWNDQITSAQKRDRIRQLLKRNANAQSQENRRSTGSITGGTRISTPNEFINESSSTANIEEQALQEFIPESVGTPPLFEEGNFVHPSRTFTGAPIPPQRETVASDGEKLGNSVAALRSAPDVSIQISPQLDRLKASIGQADIMASTIERTETGQDANMSAAYYQDEDAADNFPVQPPLVTKPVNTRRRPRRSTRGDAWWPPTSSSGSDDELTNETLDDFNNLHEIYSTRS